MRLLPRAVQMLYPVHILYIYTDTHTQTTSEIQRKFCPVYIYINIRVTRILYMYLRVYRTSKYGGAIRGRYRYYIYRVLYIF